MRVIFTIITIYKSIIPPKYDYIIIDGQIKSQYKNSLNGILY